MSTNLTADNFIDLLEELVVEFVPANVEYGPDDAAVVEAPAAILRESRRRFRRDSEGRLRRMVDGVPVFAVSTCWNVRYDGGCGECAQCVGAHSDEVVFTFWDGHEDLEVVTQFAPVELSDQEARTYIALRSQGLSIEDARAMTVAILCR